MAVRQSAPSGTWQRGSALGGTFEIVWKDTAAVVFVDTSSVIWIDREIDLFERRLSIEGTWDRQTKPIDGGARVTKPSGAPVRQSAVV